MTLESLSREIRSTPLPPGMQTRIVAIDGHGGSGKSTLASKLSKILDNAPIVHTDDFASLNKPQNWWRRIEYQVLEPLRKNEAAHYQRYDWDSDTMAEWYDIEPGSYVILEGVTSNRQEFRRYLSYSIWVETPKELCIKRGLERDGEEALPNWNRWWQEEEDYINIHQPQDFVDATIDGTKELA